MRKKNAVVILIMLMSGISVFGNTSFAAGKVSKSEATKLCRSEVERAVRNAGSDESAMRRAANIALEQCMARYGYYPK